MRPESTTDQGSMGMAIPGPTSVEQYAQSHEPTRYLDKLERDIRLVVSIIRESPSVTRIERTPLGWRWESKTELLRAD